MKDKRLFVAIPIPEAIKQEIVRSRDTLGLPFHWIPQEKFHITVLFLGNVPDENLSHINAGLQEVAGRHAAFSLSVEGLAGKPGKFQYMIWAGFHHSPAFEHLALDTAKTLGYPAGRKPLPHVNLVRSKDKIHSDKLPLYWPEPRTFPVQRIELWQSLLHPAGATYSPLAGFTLKNG